MSTIPQLDYRTADQYTRLTDRDREQLDKLLGNWREVPDKFKAALVDYLSLNPPAIPISQILGFTQFTALSAPRVTVDESTTSTSYTNLSTVGPTLEGVSPGQYVLLFGAVLATPAASAGVPLMALSVNGSTPLDNFAVQGSMTGFGVSGMTALPQTVTASNTTIEAKYRTTNAGATASFNIRWLIALRVAN